MLVLRLLRLPILTGLAFPGGIFFERSNQQQLCAGSGGEWMQAGFCAAGGAE